jgi:hypothetical protein
MLNVVSFLSKPRYKLSFCLVAIVKNEKADDIIVSEDKEEVWITAMLSEQYSMIFSQSSATTIVGIVFCINSEDSFNN